MMSGRSRRRLLALLGAACLAMAAATVKAAQAPERGSVVVASVDTIIQPVTATYMSETLDRADAAGASLVIFELQTPGGLVDATRAIVSHLLAARTPVVVWVGPSGSRAASAGFLITIAADVAAMAPGTHIGASHPVGGEGQALDETMSKKVTSDLAAYARTLAERRHRNVVLAEQAVVQSRAFTDQEALDASPPLIDVVARDIPDLLRQLDGRTITRFDGTSVALRTASAPVTRVSMSWRERLLSAIAHPNVAYLLFSLGTLGLAIELWTPGAILPGVVGSICLLLAFFAFQVLPVNYAGVLLMVLGVGLLVLELKIPSFGLLTVGGLTSLALGGLMLMDESTPAMRVSRELIAAVTIAVGGIMIVLTRLAVRAQRRPATTGVEGMIGELGRALTAISPGEPGTVAAHGEIWRATAAEPIAEGDAVRIVAIRGLTLEVRPA
jgi:membrane-bound serine protease (ClpP class)